MQTVRYEIVLFGDFIDNLVIELNRMNGSNGLNGSLRTVPEITD